MTRRRPLGWLGGVFTATEAPVIAVVYALAISMYVYREITPRDLWPILIRTGRLTGMVLFLLALATSVAFLLTTRRSPGPGRRHQRGVHQPVRGAGHHVRDAAARRYRPGPDPGDGDPRADHGPDRHQRQRGPPSTSAC